MRPASAKGPSLVRDLADVGGSRLEVLDRSRPIGEGTDRVEIGPKLTQGLRQVLEILHLKSRPRSALAAAVYPAFLKKLIMFSFFAARAVMFLSPSLASWARRLFSEARDGQNLVDLEKRRVGLLHRFPKILAAGRQTGSQFVEDDPETLRVRQAVDVVDQVEVNRLGVVLDRQQIFAGTGLTVGDLVEREWWLAAGGTGLGHPAVEEFLADQRLRPDDCRRHRPSSPGSPSSVMFITTIALPGTSVPVSSPGRETSTELTLPTLAPATRTSIRVHEGAVVEDRPDLIGIAVVIAAAYPAGRRQRSPDHEQV